MRTCARLTTTGDPTARVRFSKAVLKHIERTQAAMPPGTPITDSTLVSWIDEAISWSVPAFGVNNNVKGYLTEIK
jgi:hypothetical protein